MIKNYKKLAKTKERAIALKIINFALEAIKTERVIRKNVSLKKDNILKIKNKKINLKKYKRIFIIGFGKASSLMAKEIEKILQNKIAKGIVIDTFKRKLKKISSIKGTHPLPSKTNINATKRIVKLIKNLDKNDLVICLVSGGGSALLCYPTISFKKYLKIIKEAFTSGIDIKEFNKIRKKYSKVKNGKLAKLTKAKITSLVFSDVVGDDLATITSGPTYGKGLSNVNNILLLNNTVALEAMRKKTLSLGLKPIIYSNKLKGEAKFTGKKLLKKIRKGCLIAAGETTVNVKGSGKGGRNQELCLGAVKEISKIRNCCLISIASDGIDNVNVAGAVVDNNSLKRAEKLNLDYKKYLENNDSYHFFKKLNDLIITGKTGTNIADLMVVVKL